MNCLMEHLGIVEAEKFERDEPYSGDTEGAYMDRHHFS